MRWKAKPRASYGDMRSVTGFALLPTKMSDGTIVWLEKYRIDQQMGRTTWFDVRISCRES